MRTEGSGAAREAAAVGVGFFIGCTPFFGFHLLLVFVAGWLLRLNRLKMYVAANVSNPLFAPFLVLLEIQTGAFLRRGTLHSLTVDTLRATDPWTFGLDLLFGSVVVGLAGGVAVAAATYPMSRRRGELDDVLMAAADRYLKGGIVAWEFARGKLRGDPIYREVLGGGVLTSGASLVDIGCGQGLTLAALAEARRRAAAGRWPEGVTAPPVFEKLTGVELRPRIAQLAASALEEEATIHTGDAAKMSIPPASAILLFDVLHMVSTAEQDALLRVLKEKLQPNGVILVREANAAAGTAFRFVRFGNRLKAIVTGNCRQRFAFRSAEEWERVFLALGFTSQVRDMSSGTPFANVLFILRAPVLTAAADTRRS